MGFRRSRVEHLERFEAVDVNRTNDSGWNNLVLALRGFGQPGSGISWGCTFTAPGGMLLTMSAGMVLTDGGPVSFGAPQSVVFQPADGTFDRIDIVTTGYSEANGTNEAREFWDDNLQQPFSQPIDTEVVSGPSAVLVTTGTAAASPTQPATPTGHVLLAVVAVQMGATDLVDANVVVPSESLLATVRHSIKDDAFEGVTPVTLTWNSYDAPLFTFKMKVDVARPIMVYGSITVAPVGVQPAAVSLQMWRFPANPVAQAFYPFIVKGLGGHGTTLHIVSLDFGTGSTEQYFLRLADAGPVTLPNNQIVATTHDISIHRGFMMAVT